MVKKIKKDIAKRITTLDGMMTFGKMSDGLNALDFASFEAAELKPFTATCLVQAMRDGNVYITEKPKRLRNKPLFREDNSSLTMGKDGRYYYVFSLPGKQVGELSERLVQQALAIAQKVDRMLAEGKEVRR